VEVISGQPLDEYLHDHVFEPLGMVDTAFLLREDQLPRFTSSYFKTPNDPLFRLDRADAGRHCGGRQFLSGCGGPPPPPDASLRFRRMLAGGGELDGSRVIGRATLEFMGRNHLPGGRTLNERGQDTLSRLV